MDCSVPGSSAHGILQAKILEWGAILFSRGSSWPRDWTWVSCIAGRFFTIWATKKKKKTIRKPRAYLWHTGSLVFCHHKRGPMYPSFAQNLHSFKAQASKSWKISQSQNHSITLVGWSFLLPHHAQAMEMLSFISSCLNGGLICSQMLQDGERQGESTGLDRQLWFHLHCQRKEQHDGLQNWTWRLDFLQVSLAPM